MASTTKVKLSGTKPDTRYLNQGLIIIDADFSKIVVQAGTLKRQFPDSHRSW